MIDISVLYIMHSKYVLPDEAARAAERTNDGDRPRYYRCAGTAINTVDEVEILYAIQCWNRVFWSRETGSTILA